VTACLPSVAPMSLGADGRAGSAVWKGGIPDDARRIPRSLPILMSDKPAIGILPYEGTVGPALAERHR